MVYPHLNTPDTKFNADGDYRLKLRLPLAAPSTQAYLEEIDAAMAESLAAAKKEFPAKAKTIKAADKPYKEVVDEEGNETGDVEISYKMKAQFKSKKDGKIYHRKPALFDAKGKPLAAGVNVGGGSEGKVSCEFYQFYTAKVGAGVSLRLCAVQVLELVEFGTRSASAFGFEEEEGFTAEEPTDAVVAESSDDDKDEF